MASYYYLISSLPMLRTRGEPPMDYAEFLRQCRTAVSPGVYETLAALTVSADHGPFLSQWAEFYQSLSRELTYQRPTTGTRASSGRCRRRSTPKTP